MEVEPEVIVTQAVAAELAFPSGFRAIDVFPFDEAGSFEIGQVVADDAVRRSFEPIAYLRECARPLDQAQDDLSIGSGTAREDVVEDFLEFISLAS